MTRRRKKHHGGRPPVLAEPRDAWIPRVRCSDEERAKAVALAAEHGRSLAEWVRERVTTSGAVQNDESAAHPEG